VKKDKKAEAIPQNPLEQEKMELKKSLEDVKEMINKYNQKLVKIKEQQKRYQGTIFI